jgi:hypothetical protein
VMRRNRYFSYAIGKVPADPPPSAPLFPPVHPYCREDDGSRSHKHNDPAHRRAAIPVCGPFTLLLSRDFRVPGLQSLLLKSFQNQNTDILHLND